MRGLDEADLAAGVADARVGEGARRARAPRPGSHSALASEKATISPPARSTAGVLGADLAAAGQLEHEVGAGLARALGGGVRAAVAGDDQLEQLARIVERERVLDLRRDHLLLVVRGDDQRDSAGSEAGERIRRM